MPHQIFKFLQVKGSKNLWHARIRQKKRRFKPMCLIMIILKEAVHTTNRAGWWIEWLRQAWEGCCHVVLHCDWIEQTATVLSVQWQCRITSRHPPQAALSHSKNRKCWLVIWRSKNLTILLRWLMILWRWEKPKNSYLCQQPADNLLWLDSLAWKILGSIITVLL